MKKTFERPAGSYSRLCADILNQPHVLIAGATGSGKSVLINSILCAALYKTPGQAGLVLIDPKRVELCAYRRLPHTIRYASEPADIVNTINEAVTMMEYRYQLMQKQRLRKSNFGHVYIVIDEFADLITTSKKYVLQPLCRIAQLGRAANIHLIVATQRPTRDIINGQIKVNIDARIALRCPTAQDSRNIINVNGAEHLPRYGQGYYLTPESCTPRLVTIPLTQDEEISRLIKWWEKQRGWRWKASYLMS